MRTADHHRRANKILAAIALVAVLVTTAFTVLSNMSDYKAASTVKPAHRSTAETVPTLAPSPTSPPPTAATTPRPPVTVGTTASGQRYGFALSLAALPEAELNQTLADMKAMGVGWVRFDIQWSEAEHDGPGQYNWKDFDRAVAGVRRHGLQPLAILDYTPEWARLPECKDNQMCAPADPAAYGRFAAAAAKRYAGQGVKHWEIWNEPNIDTFFQPAPDAARYTALLKSAHANIKRVDSSAVVITGGTSPADTWGKNIAPREFIKRIYDNGGRGSFDAVAHHPYTYPFAPSHKIDHAWTQTNAIRSLMVSKGDAGKQIWLTEYGIPTGGPGPAATSGFSASETGYEFVTESLQAKQVADALGKYKQFSWAGPIFWYTYKDSGTTPDTNENFFGLVRANGSKKPAYDAFKSAIR